MKITDRGVRHNDGGANHNAQLLWYAPGGVNPNDKTVMINPPGAYHNGGVNENLTPAGINITSCLFIVWSKSQTTWIEILDVLVATKVQYFQKMGAGILHLRLHLPKRKSIGNNLTFLVVSNAIHSTILEIEVTCSLTCTKGHSQLNQNIQ